ncbi:Uncharacterized damage-inducible protein DinB (forms a four-helix bundle) [Andreprevotia lacus DSM 23236]|uniref:Uncharacterized damage-inducible protein DinB (Forms a four-helix bundle) n=1 Tax=Andreprevotia lacus DSM 23236 TaxID=1121001 RepID=A0A1W1WX49_9NEIS|nr:DinB family protein [Andreprevotia lacus]SMC16214.1 Uncharacterized damage-inducible protein DinB (forms a four-helix bundle) [Andreprevotia lacus DSM 23236]
MSQLEQFALLARYNAWMNAKLIDAARQLPAGALTQERGAFFGSILGTLNHLIVADTIWLKRFTHHPAGFAALASVAALPTPDGLNDIPCADLDSYIARRSVLDDALSGMVAALQPADLDVVLDYKNFKGIAMRKAFAPLLLHVFNHQTHHRGQASTLFFQAGVDIGVTDLPMLIPDEV